MKILFAGTPEIAVPSLEEINNNFEIIAVLTNPDKSKGRGRKISNAPIKEKALELGLKLIQPEKLDAEIIEEIKELKADLLVCFAYGKIFSKAFLDIFPLGGINIHPSLLPEYRGPSPLNSAILNRNKKTGITVQELALKMDCGDILKQIEIELDMTETTGSLSQKVSVLSAKLISDTLNNFTELNKNKISQDDSKASYCKLIDKNDGKLFWKSTSEDIEAKIRAYYPWPKAFTFWGEKKLFILNAELYHGEMVFEDSEEGKVLAVDKKCGILIKTATDILAVKKLQLQSKKALDFKSFLNGNRDIIGDILGDN